MGNYSSPVSPKSSKSSTSLSSTSSSNSRSSSSLSSKSSSSSSTMNDKLVKNNASQTSFRLNPRIKARLNEFFQKYAGNSKEGASDKNKAKTPMKERTKPVEVKLHTQQRAVKRAGFNYLVECKTTMIEHQRQQEERFRKMIEEEEIKMLRREMVPRAQLMPLFDRPFLPRRSTRPLTIPKEPSFLRKSWRCMESYNFPRLPHQSTKVIK